MIENALSHAAFIFRAYVRIKVNAAEDNPTFEFPSFVWKYLYFTAKNNESLTVAAPL
jgi:hypothetical protein